MSDDTRVTLEGVEYDKGVPVYRFILWSTDSQGKKAETFRLSYIEVKNLRQSLLTLQI